MVARVAAVVIWTSWAVWALVWLGTGLHTSARGPRTRTRRVSLSAIPAAVVVVLVVHVLAGQQFWQALVVSNTVVLVIGMLVLVGGLAFTLWARRVLGLMWSSAPKVKAGHELRTDGPYAVTRHPIYTGMLAMLLGTSLAAGLGLYTILMPLGLVIFLVKIRTEEQLMTAEFPQDYPRYRQQVPQLIPGLRSRRTRL